MTERGNPIAKLRAWLQEVGKGLRCEKGQTLVEYALIVGFMGMATVVAMTALRPAFAPAFQAVADVIDEYMIV